MDYQNFKLQDFNEPVELIIGSNFHDCGINTIITFEKCNFYNCDITTKCKFIQCNLTDCEIIRGCEFDRSNIVESANELNPFDEDENEEIIEE